MKFFDSHAHYNDERFETEIPGGAKTLLRALFDDNVEAIVNVGVDPEYSVNCIKLAEKYPKMYAAVGIHPSDTRFLSDPDDDIRKIEALLDHKKVVALGEIGLDYHYPDTDKEKQKDYLYRQLKLAERTGARVIFHDRDAHGDSMEAVAAFPGVTGVFHCFSGSAEMAKELVRLGWYVSFTGVITYSNARKVCEAVKVVPDDRIMIETDAPYLSPVPMRGKINRSDYLQYTAEKMAELRNTTTEYIAGITTENAKRFFNISE